MKFCIYIIVFITSLACSKTTYIIKQGYQQINLETNGRLNEDVLADEKIDNKLKQKIQDIQKYKNFFYDYFQEESTSIYNKTTFLEDDAVTYLVIASPHDKIKALEHEFPIVGKFPYLGFFNKKDAKEYASELKAKDYEIYIRDVYAYSTLNQWIFSDNILSSFFHFEKDELATLIFHELFHTVFFAPDEVEFNENLAQFFSRKLVEIYFKKNQDERDAIKLNRKKERVLYRAIAKHAKKLNDEYQKVESNFVEIRKNYIQEKMFPDIETICDVNKISDCWPLNRNWNNAKFVSFITYESKQDKLSDYYERKNFELKSFYKHIKKKYKKYQKKNRELSFQKYFFSKE